MKQIKGKLTAYSQKTGGLLVDNQWYNPVEEIATEIKENGLRNLPIAVGQTVILSIDGDKVGDVTMEKSPTKHNNRRMVVDDRDLRRDTQYAKH